MVESFERAIEEATARRDVAIEQVFKAIWTHPLIQALAGELSAHSDARKPSLSHRLALEELRDLKLEAMHIISQIIEIQPKVVPEVREVQTRVAKIVGHNSDDTKNVQDGNGATAT